MIINAYIMKGQSLRWGKGATIYFYTLSFDRVKLDIYVDHMLLRISGAILI